MSNKVSIVTPFYNTNPEYLRKYLETVLSQTFQDFRIIMVDDGSYKYDYSFLSNIDKVLFIRNPCNYGIPKSLNIAYSYSDSEYIVRFDSDDYFSKIILEKEVEFLDSNPKYIAVCTDLILFGLRTGIYRRPDSWSIEEAANGKDYGFAPSMMFRSEVLRYIKTNESLPICEDFEFHIKLMKYGKIKAIHEPLYYYRKHSEQITREISKEKRKEYFLKAVETAKRILDVKDE